MSGIFLNRESRIDDRRSRRYLIPGTVHDRPPVQPQLPAPCLSSSVRSPDSVSSLLSYCSTVCVCVSEDGGGVLLRDQTRHPNGLLGPLRPPPCSDSSVGIKQQKLPANATLAPPFASRIDRRRAHPHAKHYHCLPRRSSAAYPPLHIQGCAGAARHATGRRYSHLPAEHLPLLTQSKTVQ